MKTNISNLMTHNPITCFASSSLNEVMLLMNKEKISHRLITNEDMKLLGIISKQDVLKQLKSLIKRTGGQEYNRKLLDNTLASDIMTAECITLTPHDAPEYAVELLLQQEFHALPVLEDDKVVGLVGFSNLLQSYYQNSI